MNDGNLYTVGVLQESLSSRVTVFLSDVETDIWQSGTLEKLAAQSHSFIVTRGPEGAEEYKQGHKRWLKPYPVGGVDCFLLK